MPLEEGMRLVLQEDSLREVTDEDWESKKKIKGSLTSVEGDLNYEDDMFKK